MASPRAAMSFGPYVVEARIGSGGMGVVYRARHRETAALVALKTVQVGSAELIAAFRREVQVLASLHHPGIVRILDQGLSGGTPWYAMALVRGRPLSTLLRGPLASQTEVVVGAQGARTAALTEDVDASEPSGSRLRVTLPGNRSDLPPLPELLGIVRKVCGALGFLHAHGLVHRDLKPENILIQSSGDPVLVDFGIAGRFGDSAGREVLSLTRSAGTLAYMAPEQASGRFVDARADLFSLGCVLYECIVGEVPFGRAGLYDVSLPRPQPPSHTVSDVSPELDELVMGLLESDPRDRVGYAEDVAARLDRITEQDRPDSGPASQPAYLYRPEFAGRGAALERLSAALNEPRSSGGSLTLVTGESGLGKTRLLLELGARAVSAGMTVITGECNPVGAVASSGGARGGALHPFRNLLLGVADSCRVGGAPITERLLAGRGAVLATYEPALGQLLVPAALELPPLAPVLARARVFTALDGLLEALTGTQPLLLLLDDLQWADSLSLEFLTAFASHAHPGSRVSIVATYRSEEMSDELSALGALPSVTSERLERFDRDAVSKMVSGMLAVAEPPRDWVAFLEEESAGNPFFIAEYLRAAVAERLLTRTTAGRWTLGDAGAGSSLRERLGLPATISALVGRRLSGLDADALLVAQAAAVLGREFDLPLVAKTAGVELTLVDAAYARLRQRQILEDEASGRSGFVHDKLREITYGLIERGQRRSLHRRTADALRTREAEGGMAVELGTLGHHYAEAENAVEAAIFFEQAAARARKHHANRDAARLYLLALRELEKASDHDAPLERKARSRVREALAEVLVLHNQLADARAVLERALLETDVDERVARARRRRLQARTWERQHEHEKSLASCAQAEQELGEPPETPEQAREYWFERVQIQIQSTLDLYFLSRVTELSRSIDRVRPLIEAQGTPLQRSQFFQALAHMNVRRDRYRISPASLDYCRASLAAAEQVNDPSELAVARFILAFTMMLAGQELEAEPLFVQAIAGADRTGDTTFQARFLAYYSVLQRRLGRIAETRTASARALETAEKQGFHDYVGVAHGNLCWAALREGGDVETPAQLALSAWARLPAGYPYPLQWLARAPLATYLAERGRSEEALSHWQALLDETQHLLPDALRETIEQSITKRSHDGTPDTASVNAIGVLARSLGYI